MEKKIIRNLVKEKLKIVESTFYFQSKNICSQILNSEFYKNASVVFLYMSLKDEVDLSLVFEDALKKGKKVYLPKVKENSSLMDFYQVAFNKSLDEQVEKGSFGILEPFVFEENKFVIDKDLTNLEILFLIPGRAFSKNGKRVGRGKGFYDIYLSKLLKNKTIYRKNLHLCGVCFKEQVFLEEDIICDDYDITMDYLFFSFC